MRRIFIALALIAPVESAAADPSLQEMYSDASSCSDSSLRDLATRTCDPPETIAAMAVAKCQGKWNTVADKAIGPPPADASPKERTRSLKVYSDAMEYEYVHVAELTAIEMRKTNANCGFE